MHHTTTCTTGNDINIKMISGEDTLKIRRDVMWPDKQVHELCLPEDDSGKHYGLFKGTELVSIASLFVHDATAQFRKFATLPQFQNHGYGSRLLQHIISECQKTGIKKLWCNARTEKKCFYKRFGFIETNKKFQRDGKSYLIMELSISQ